MVEPLNMFSGKSKYTKAFKNESCFALNLYIFKLKAKVSSTFND